MPSGLMKALIRRRMTQTVVIESEAEDGTFIAQSGEIKAAVICRGSVDSGDPQDRFTLGTRYDVLIEAGPPARKDWRVRWINKGKVLSIEGDAPVAEGGFLVRITAMEMA